MEWYHLLSHCTYTYFAHILHPPLHECVNDFAFFLSAWVEKETNQLTLILLLYSWIWNAAIFYLAALIPISPKFHVLAYLCVNDFVDTRVRKRDKPTIVNTFATVVVWIATIFYLAAPIAHISRPPLHVCQRFSILVGTWVEIETNQVSLILLLQLEYGMVPSSISAPIPVSPNFTSWVCQRFCIFFLSAWVEKETNQVSLIHLLQLEYGMVPSSISLHLSLSHPNFASSPTCVSTI